MNPIPPPVAVATSAPASPAVDALSLTFAALADPTRRAILARLAEGEHSVKRLAEPFAMSAPAVTKHLKVLERAGLISRSRDAQWRPCKLEAAPIREATAWMEQYRRHWEARLDRLDDFLASLEPAGGTATNHASNEPPPAAVDVSADALDAAAKREPFAGRRRTARPRRPQRMTSSPIPNR